MNMCTVFCLQGGYSLETVIIEITISAGHLEVPFSESRRGRASRFGRGGIWEEDQRVLSWDMLGLMH